MKAELVDIQLPFMTLGEGPVWSAASKRLYWVDIEGQKIHAYTPESTQHDEWSVDGKPSFLVPIQDDEWLVAVDNSIKRMNLISVSSIDYADIENYESGTRFNDGKCDPAGRLWAGSIALEQQDRPIAALYRLEKNRLIQMLPGLTNSNGLGWYPNGQQFYHTDTAREDAPIIQYDYCVEAGVATNPRSFIAPTKRGLHDGLTLDAEGRLYTAKWGGGCVEVYSPQGQIEHVIELPVSQVTSCTFGGSAMDILYITTARQGLGLEQLQREPLAGALFAIRLNTQGLLPHSFIP